MNSTKLILVSAIVIPSLISLIYAISSSIAGFRKDQRRLFFSIFGFSISAWILLQLPLVIIRSIQFADISYYAYQISTYLIAFTFAIFITSFVYEKKQNYRFILISFTGLLISILSLFIFKPYSSVNIDATSGLINYNYETFNYTLSILYSVIIITCSMFILFRKIRKTKSTNQSAILRRLSIAAIAFISSIVLFTYVFPTFLFNNLIFEYASTNIATVAFLISIGSFVFLERVIDLRKNSWRVILKYSLLAIFTISYVAVYGKVVSNIHVLNENNYLVSLAQDVFLVATTILIVRLANRLIGIWFVQYELSIKGLSQALEKLRSTLDIQELSVKYIDTLVEVFRPTEVEILLYQHDTKDYYLAFHSHDSTSFTKLESGREDVKHTANIDEFIRSYGEIKTNESKIINLNREDLISKNIIGYYVGYCVMSEKNTALILMSEKGDGQEYSDNEISLLNATVNDFVLIFQNALRFEEIQQFNITLQKRVEDATSKLKRSNTKLKELDEAKDEFISMASHQLRTPLTSMKGYVSMVLEGDAGKVTEMQHKLLDQAFVSSQRMVYLIADLLNVSRLKTGKFIVETKPTNLAELVEGEISQLIETAKGRNLELSYDKPKNFPELMLDETKIRQVVMNFTDNAIYYTPAGGHIKVIVEDKPETIEFRVEDDGLGVPKAEQHHLFTKFYRAGNARKARPDGTGLGLFMAKKVIAVQGGAIIFHSTEGKGSTFGFSFAKANLLPPVIDTKIDKK